MTQIVKELTKLLNVSELVQDQEMARLADVSKRIDKITLRISDLNQDLDRFLKNTGLREPESLYQHDRNWLKWRREKILALNVRLSTLEAERESTRIGAKKAFGRAQAVQSLIAKTKSR